MAYEDQLDFFVLENGLRVVLDPQEAYGSTGVAVHYDVGFRSEPVEQSGIAHLCEHLLCDGASDKLVDGVLAVGGVLNATTVADHTHYYGVVPAGDVDTLLRLEAERMTIRAVDESSLAAQVAIVKDEIRANIDGRPFGGFPWMWLSSVAYEHPWNSHNGYGAEHVDALGTVDVERFLGRHYAPANAVLTVSGAMDRNRVTDLVASLFGTIANDLPDRPDLEVGVSDEEPALSEDRIAVRHDRHAPYPATAVCFRAPEPVDLSGELLGAVVLADVMAADPLGLLDRRCAGSGISAVGSYLGLFGNPFDGRGPIPWVVEAYHSKELGSQAVIELVRDELSHVAVDGVAAEVQRAARALAAQLWRTQDQTMGRMLMIGATALVHGSPVDALRLPGQIRDVTVEDVRHAAATLLDQKVATLTLEVD